jgi:hypothetical protein
MVILQILLGVGAFGIIGFVLYWFGIILKAGPEATKKQIDDDPRFK